MDLIANFNKKNGITPVVQVPHVIHMSTVVMALNDKANIC